MNATPPLPSMYGSRPAYMDNLFNNRDASQMAPQKSPSLRSAHSSVSSTSPIDVRNQSNPRPLSPAFEEDSGEDKMSIRSFRSTFRPRVKLRNVFNRRTYPQVKETIEYDEEDEVQRKPSQRSIGSRKSLPKLHTTFSSPPRRKQSFNSKPLPPPPPPHKVDELTCQRCYYFHARNCNGYVFGGSHGDACESCAQAGFLGAP